MRAWQHRKEPFFVVIEWAAVAVKEEAHQPVDAKLFGGNLASNSGDEIIRAEIDTAWFVGHRNWTQFDGDGMASPVGVLAGPDHGTRPEPGTTP